MALNFMFAKPKNCYNMIFKVKDCNAVSVALSIMYAVLF